MKEINVLDHGFVRLVDSMGGDLSVARAARVSYDADWRAGEDAGSDKRLISYLWKNKHTSPFEAVTFTFEVKAPIFVFRQWHRHRTWSFNEISARYSELPEEFYVPRAEDVGVQSKNNKQARDIGAGEREIAETCVKRMRETCEAAFEMYHAMLLHDIPRELARTVLPVATYSRMFATVDLLNLLKFLSLRLHPHAQFEIRAYAEAMLSLVAETVPACIEAWKEGQA